MEYRATPKKYAARSVSNPNPVSPLVHQMLGKKQVDPKEVFKSRPKVKRDIAREASEVQQDHSLSSKISSHPREINAGMSFRSDKTQGLLAQSLKESLVIDDAEDKEYIVNESIYSQKMDVFDCDELEGNNMMKSSSELISLSDYEMKQLEIYMHDQKRIEKSEEIIKNLQVDFDRIKNYLNTLIISEQAQLIPYVVKV